MSAELFYTNTSDLGTDTFSDSSSISRYLDFYGNYLWVSFISSIIRDYIVAVCIFCVQTFFVFIFYRYSEFRTRINLFVLFNSCLGILQFVRLVHSRLSNFFDYLTLEIICIEVEFDHLSHIFYFVLAVFLGFDCVVSKSHNYVTRLYLSFFIQVVISVNLIFLIILITKVTYCFLNPIGWLFARLHEIKTIAYTVMVLLMLILNLAAKRTSLDSLSKHGLKIANITVFAYLPVYLHHVLIIYFRLHYFLRQILIFSQFLADILAQMHPFVVLYLVFKRNDVLNNSNLIVYFRNITKRNKNDVENDVKVEILDNEELNNEEQTDDQLNESNYRTALLM